MKLLEDRSFFSIGSSPPLTSPARHIRLVIASPNRPRRATRKPIKLFWIGVDFKWFGVHTKCMTERSPADFDAGQQAAAGLSKLSLVLRHQAWQASGRQGLTPTQAQILAHIASADGVVSVSNIADSLSITKGTASEAVSALERKGLIRKVRDPNDGRALILELTSRGRAEATQSAQRPEVVVNAVDALPDSEKAGFLRGLTGVIRTLQQQGAVPTGRMCTECRYFRPNRYRGKKKPHRCEYLKSAIADVQLRLDCPEMEPASPSVREQLVSLLFEGKQLAAAEAD